MSSNPAKGVKWDLSPLYNSLTDPKIEKDKKKVETLTKKFIKNYKDKINSPKLTASFLLKSIKDYETLFEKLYALSLYAGLKHSQDTNSAKIGAFYQNIEEFSARINTELLWYDLEWQKLPKKYADNIIKNKTVAKYKHSLTHSRVFSPFSLSEKEEIVITKKDQTGSQAFTRLYDQTDSSNRFSVDKKELSYSQVMSIFKTETNRVKLKNASQSLTKTYQNNQKFYTFVLNTLLHDSKLNREMRGYRYPQHRTFLNYEIDDQVVENLTTTVQKNYSISERYYLAKKKLLKTKTLYEWDRYSPIFKSSSTKYSWAQAKKLILNTFAEFDLNFKKIATEFYDDKWIDADIAPYKRGGAFCSYGTPSLNPYVLLSFTGDIDSVSTLAHELGHGIHAYLSKKQPVSEYWPSIATAEIASTFAESVVFDKLMDTLTSKNDKINLLANKIQGSFATVFRQTAFYLFETDIHNHRSKKGELSIEDFNNYYQKRLQAMFGKGLTLTDQHKYWWMPVSHFYHYNFYVFTYAFGELLSLSLYAKYKKEGDKFTKNYLEALSLGGSKSPEEIVKVMGIDINDKNFWNQGLDLLDSYVTEFEELVA